MRFAGRQQRTDGAGVASAAGDAAHRPEIRVSREEVAPWLT
jgi:hypothetical protein